MRQILLGLMASVLMSGWTGATNAEISTPYAGTVIIETEYTYADLVERLINAVKSHKMGVVARASATVGAQRVLNLTIPGNQVVIVFHPRFAVPMLEASVPAGIEAPLRYYITDGSNGKATLTYRTPTSVFSPYENAKLNEMARELDDMFKGIAHKATAS